MPTSNHSGNGNSGTSSGGSGQTTRGRNQDRARVAGGQKHEVDYEARKAGVSPEAVKDAVKSVGNSRDAVEAELTRRGR